MTRPSISEDGRISHVARAVRARLPELNFITLHYTYFILTSLFTGLVFWGSSTPFGNVRFIDAIFLTTSAMTEAGLNTVNLSILSTWQQVMLFFLVMMGSTIFVSIFVLFVRLRVFEKEFRSLKKQREERRQARKNAKFSRAKSLVSRRLRRAHPLTEEMVDEETKNKIESARSQQQKSPVFVDEEAAIGYISYAESEKMKSPDGENLSWQNSREEAAIEDSGQETENVRNGGPQHTSPSLVRRGSEHEESNVRPPSHHVGFLEGTKFGPKSDSEYEKIHKPVFSFSGVGASSASSLRAHSTSDAKAPTVSKAFPLINNFAKADSYFPSSRGWIARNSQFHGLSMEERELLGGREYKAVVFLSFLVPFYFFIWQALGAIALGAWVSDNRAGTAFDDGIQPWWVGIFNAISAFNNSGMSLLDANMVAFQNSPFMLLSMGLFILAGNTAYPIFLRMTVWAMWKIIPEDNEEWAEDKETLRFLLDHPRRVYTNMFPSRHTWWLGWAVIGLNVIDWAAFEVLNIGNTHITNLHGYEVIDGLFQSFAVRSGGFYVIPIPTIRASLRFLYVIMMYISVYPVSISMRTSNVYEERSLGIFQEDVDDSTGSDPTHHTKDPTTPTGTRLGNLKRRATNLASSAAPAPKRETRSFFVRQQLRAQLAHDAWWICIAIFIILIIEGSKIEADPVNWSIFNYIFEVVSAYATVGLSVGVPNNAYSFSGSFHTSSKLVMIAVMLRGRHRGLPVAIDHAVQLPGKRLFDAELEDGEKRLEKLSRSHSFHQFSAENFKRGKDMKRDGNGQATGKATAFSLQSPTALREKREMARSNVEV